MTGGGANVDVDAVHRERGFALRLTAVALGGLAVRIAYVAAFLRHARLTGDEVWFSYQANTLSYGRGFNSIFGRPQADHPPLTALVLTPTSWLSDHSVFAQRLTMTVVGMLLIVAVGFLAREIAGDRVGLIAAVLTALYPGFVIADGVLMSEPLAAIGVASTLLFLYRLVQRGEDQQVRNALLAGGALGVAVLARPEIGLLLVVAVLPTVWLCRGSWRRRLGLGGAAVGIFVLVLAPWVVFNLTRFQKPVFVSTNDGITLAAANCPPAYSGPALGGASLSCVLPGPGGADQSVDEATYRHRGLSYIRHHAGRLPVVVAARIGRTWSVFRPFQTARFAREEGRPLRASEAAILVFYATVPFAAAGAWVLHRRRVTLVPLLSTVVAVTLISGAFMGGLRTRDVAEISFVVLAAVAIDALIARARARDDAIGRSRDAGTAPEYVTTRS